MFIKIDKILIKFQSHNWQFISLFFKMFSNRFPYVQSHFLLDKLHDSVFCGNQISNDNFPNFQRNVFNGFQKFRVVIHDAHYQFNWRHFGFHIKPVWIWIGTPCCDSHWRYIEWVVFFIFFLCRLFLITFQSCRNIFSSCRNWKRRILWKHWNFQWVPS